MSNQNLVKREVILSWSHKKKYFIATQPKPTSHFHHLTDHTIHPCCLITYSTLMRKANEICADSRLRLIFKQIKLTWVTESMYTDTLAMVGTGCSKKLDGEKTCKVLNPTVPWCLLWSMNCCFRSIRNSLKSSFVEKPGTMEGDKPAEVRSEEWNQYVPHYGKKRFKVKCMFSSW